MKATTFRWVVSVSLNGVTRAGLARLNHFMVQDVLSKWVFVTIFNGINHEPLQGRIAPVAIFNINTSLFITNLSSSLY
jgi:hypothetical protein